MAVINMYPTIICVDTESSTLDALYEQLNSYFGENYTIKTVLSADEALKLVDKNTNVPVIISDYCYCNNGDDFFNCINKRNSKIKKILLTNSNSIDKITDTINDVGLFGFIQKPHNSDELFSIISKALKVYENDKASFESNQKYKLLHEKNLKKNEGLVNAIIYAIDLRNFRNMGSCRRTAKYAKIIGRALKMPQKKLENLKYCALFKDIGKLAITDADLCLINENGIYCPDYYSILAMQASYSENILASFDYKDEIISAIKYQFEQYDGKGPFRLKGKKIPIESRIIHIASFFESIKNNQKKKFTIDEIINRFQEKKGTIFDPELVDMFTDLIKPKF